jgi:hypothetical protein
MVHSLGATLALSDIAVWSGDQSQRPQVGMSIAMNATPDARAVATHVLDTEDLRDVLAFLGPAGEVV